MCGQVTTPTAPVKTKEEVCNGCMTYKTIDEETKEIIYCFVSHVIDGHYCPCSKCILKMVCQEVCFPFELYLNRKGSLCQNL